MTIEFKVTEKRVDVGAHTYCAIWDARRECWKMLRWPTGNRHSCHIQQLHSNGWQFTMQKKDAPPLKEIAELQEYQLVMVVEASKDDPAL